MNDRATTSSINSLVRAFISLSFHPDHGSGICPRVGGVLPYQFCPMGGVDLSTPPPGKGQGREGRWRKENCFLLPAREFFEGESEVPFEEGRIGLEHPSNYFRKGKGSGGVDKLIRQELRLM